MLHRLVAATLQFLRASSVNLNDLGNTHDASINWPNNPQIALMLSIVGGFQLHPSPRARPMPKPNGISSYFDNGVNNCCLSANGRTIGMFYPVNSHSSFRPTRHSFDKSRPRFQFQFLVNINSGWNDIFFPISFRLRMHQNIDEIFVFIWKPKFLHMNIVHEWAFDANEFNT